MITRSAVTRSISLLLLLLLLSAARANGQDTIAVIGARELTLNVQQANPTADFLVPIRLVPDTSRATFQLHVVQVTLSGQPRDRSAFVFEPPSAESSGVRMLRVVADLTKLTEPGAYAVRVQSIRTDTTGKAPQLFEFTFTRPAAELRITTPLRIEQTTYCPLVRCFTQTKPDQVLFSETGGRSALITADTAWRAELRASNNAATVALLRVRLPERVDAWKQSQASVEVEGDPPLGSTSGTLTVRSAQLTARALDVAVEVVTRISRIWLLLTILFGIRLGYETRTRMDARKRKDDAQRAVNEQNDRLTELLRETTTPDGALRNRLAGIRDRLRATVKTDVSTAAELTAAAALAKTETDEALKEAEEERVQLRQELAGLRAALGSPEGHAPEIEVIVRQELERATSLENRLANGEIAIIEDAMVVLRRDLARSMVGDVREWLTRVEGALERIGHWPERNIDKVITEISAAAAEIRELDPPDSINSLSNVLLPAAQLAGDIQDRLLNAGAQSLRTMAEDARANLERLGDTDVKTAAAKVGAAVEPLGKPGLTLAAMADAARELRHALQHAITTAYGKVRDSAADPAEPPGLAEGRFEQALNHVRQLWVERRKAEEEERALGGRGGQVTSIAEFTRRQAAAIGDAVPVNVAGWDVALVVEVPRVAIAGEPITVRADIVCPAGAQPAIDVRWIVPADVVQEQLPEPLKLRFTPQNSGRFDVQAVAIERGTGREIVKRITVAVASPFPSTVDLIRRGQRDERIQSVVAGVLIALSGYMIFRASWFGTGEDWLAALLWGYSVDIGVAKVLEIATPLKSRQVPFRT